MAVRGIILPPEYSEENPVMAKRLACMTLWLLTGGVQAQTLQFPDPSMLPPAAQSRDEVPLPAASTPAASAGNTAPHSSYVYPPQPNSVTTRVQQGAATYVYPPFPATPAAPNAGMPHADPMAYANPNALLNLPALPTLLPPFPPATWQPFAYPDSSAWQGTPHNAAQAFQHIAELKRQLAEANKQKEALEQQVSSLKDDYHKLEQQVTALQSALANPVQPTAATQPPADNAKAADADNDGVPDTADLCADTAAHTDINALGCGKNAGIPLKGVNFEKGSAMLTAASLPVLDKAANILQQHPKLNLEVGGHTDSSGDATANQKLAQARAERVMAYFIDKGIPAARLSAKGYGATVPLADNSTAEGKAQNRRVELKLLP